LEGARVVLALRIRGEGAGQAKARNVVLMARRLRAALYATKATPQIAGYGLTFWRTYKELKEGIVSRTRKHAGAAN